jgi:hypothetical protein
LGKEKGEMGKKIKKTKQEELEVFEIPEGNMPLLEEKIKKLAKRAKKLGSEPVSIEVVGERLYKYEEMENGVKVKKAIKYIQVIAKGEAPSFNGWSLVGRIQHIHHEDLSVMLSAPGWEIPKEYRDASWKCDHCKTKRLRKDTFIVHHDDEGYKQVGRTCIADFLGHKDPKHVTRMAEYVMTFHGLVRDAEGPEWAGGIRVEYDYLMDFLPLVALCIDVDGWVSKKMAREEGDHLVPTADRACQLMFPPPPSSKSRREWEEKIAMLTDKHRETAVDSVKWASDLGGGEDLNDYLYNLWVLAESGLITSSTMGIAASMVSSYLRTIEREATKAIETSSEYFGDVKQRLDLTVEVVAEYFLGETQYGSMFLIKMKTEEGNIAIWKTGPRDWEIGSTYKIKATVKDHSEFRGVKQTVLTRCKKVEEVIA